MEDGQGNKEQTPPAGATPPTLSAYMEICMWWRWWRLSSPAWKEQKPAAEATPRKLQSTVAEPTPYKLLLQFAYAIGAAAMIAYAAFVIYVTATYTHSWIQKLQMLPLCIVALTAPIMWKTIIRIRK